MTSRPTGRTSPKSPGPSGTSLWPVPRPVLLAGCEGYRHKVTRLVDDVGFVWPAWGVRVGLRENRRGDHEAGSGPRPQQRRVGLRGDREAVPEHDQAERAGGSIGGRVGPVALGSLTEGGIANDGDQPAGDQVTIGQPDAATAVDERVRLLSDREWPLGVGSRSRARADVVCAAADDG